MRYRSEKINKLYDKLKIRNIDIFKDYLSGMPHAILCRKYKISTARISAIIKTFKIMIGHSEDTRTFFLENDKKHPGWIRHIEKLYLRK